LDADLVEFRERGGVAPDRVVIDRAAIDVRHDFGPGVARRKKMTDQISITPNAAVIADLAR
jgi:hypothetical protein